MDRGDCRTALAKPGLLIIKSETTSFPYFPPKDSESLKILDIRLWKVETKKVETVPQKWTHTQPHIWTNRLIESIGPEGWCFENFRYSDCLCFNNVNSKNIFLEWYGIDLDLKQPTLWHDGDPLN